MNEEHFENTKQNVLTHISTLFEEIEQEAIVSHQEKYALLEDAFSSATDVDELRVAFDQWFGEHSEDVGFDHDVDEIWDQALADDDEFDDDASAFEDDDEEDEEEEELY